MIILENNKLFQSKIQLLFSLFYNGYLRDIRLFKAFLQVQLKQFIPKKLVNKVRLYDDAPVLFFFEEENHETLRTISAPHMISIMLQELLLKEDDDLLILGAKSGYIAALAHNLAPKGKILILEANSDIAEITATNLKKLNLDKDIEVILKNPLEGMPDMSPWQKILVTGAIKQERINSLLRQLDPNEGVLFAPIGENFIQNYTQIIRMGDDYFGKKHLQVRFTPLITQIELDKLELITDIDDFEIHINYTSDILKEVKLEPFTGSLSNEIKPHKIFLAFLENIDNSIDLLKIEPSIRETNNVIENFEIIIKILKKLKNEIDFKPENIENSLNLIKSYNIIRGDLERKVSIDSTMLYNEKADILEKLLNEISNFQEIIKEEINRITKSIS